MKKVSVICFFSFLFLFLVGFAIGKWNYPNQKPEKQDNQDANIGLNLAVQSAQSTTTCDTIYVEQNYYEATNQTVTNIKSIPAQYIDHTREDIETFLSDYQKNPSLEDKKMGLSTISLLSFSVDKIIVLKSYDSLSKEAGYYLIAKNHKICVYYEDKKRIYFETELTLEDFPEPIQLQLIQGKHVSSESEVYAFIESYTS